MNTWVIIPALNEETGLRLVLGDLPPVAGVIVVDNGSVDGTAAVARELGAVVVEETLRGYGSACLAGIAALPEDADLIVFMDADYSDHPEQLPSLLQPILQKKADLVIGSRVLGKTDRGALLPQARFGNWLATGMIQLLFGKRFTDLGPMRAIRRSSLDALGMRDKSYGWTVEMQVRAVLKKLACAEVGVSYRRRIGRSKISGTLKGTVLAGFKIVGTILTLRFGITR